MGGNNSKNAKAKAEADALVQLKIQQNRDQQVKLAKQAQQLAQAQQYQNLGQLKQETENKAKQSATLQEVTQRLEESKKKLRELTSNISPQISSTNPSVPVSGGGNRARYNNPNVSVMGMY